MTAGAGAMHQDRHLQTKECLADALQALVLIGVGYLKPDFQQLRETLKMVALALGTAGIFKLFRRPPLRRQKKTFVFNGLWCYKKLGKGGILKMVRRTRWRRPSSNFLDCVKYKEFKVLCGKQGSISAKSRVPARGIFKLFPRGPANSPENRRKRINVELRKTSRTPAKSPWNVLAERQASLIDDRNFSSLSLLYVIVKRPKGRRR